MPRVSCKVTNYFPDDRCDLKAVTRGLCARHYEKARRLGKLEMKGTGPNGGRPTGPRLATPLAQDWLEGPDRTVAELQEVARKLAYEILTDPASSQMERTQFAKMVMSLEDKDVDPKLTEKFKEMLGQARGLTAVPDE